MSKNGALDRIELEKIMERAKATRGEYICRYGTAALVVVGSTLAIALWPRTNGDQLATTVQMERVATNSSTAELLSP